jgi:hypothetical protein
LALRSTGNAGARRENVIINPRWFWLLFRHQGDTCTMQDLSTEVRSSVATRRHRHQGDTCTMQDLSTEVRSSVATRRHRHQGDTCTMQDLSTEVRSSVATRRHRHQRDTCACRVCAPECGSNAPEPPTADAIHWHCRRSERAAELPEQREAALIKERSRRKRERKRGSATTSGSLNKERRSTGAREHGSVPGPVDASNVVTSILVHEIQPIKITL